MVYIQHVFFTLLSGVVLNIIIIIIIFWCYNLLLERIDVSGCVQLGNNVSLIYGLKNGDRVHISFVFQVSNVGFLLKRKNKKLSNVGVIIFYACYKSVARYIPP